MKAPSILLLGILYLCITACDSYTSKVPLGSPEESVIDSSLIGFWRAYEAFESEEEFDIEIIENEDEELDQFISILPFDENYFIVDYLNFEDTTASLMHFFNQTNHWRNLSREENKYNSAGDITESISQKWDNENQTWINISRIVNSYDSIGNLIIYLKENWNNQPKEWVSEIMISTSNNGSKMKEKSTQHWNGRKNSWINRDHSLYYYDKDGSLTEHLLEKGDTATNEWRNASRELYSYDNYGNTIETIRLTWNRTLNDWESYLRSTRSYDSSGNNTENTSYTWNKDKSDWDKKSRVILVYDTDGNKIENKTLYLNPSTGNWSNNRRIIYKYDEKGNQTDELSQYLDTTIMEWKNSQGNPIHHTIFNDSGQKTELVKGAKTKENYFYDKNGNLLIKILYRWSIDERDWLKSNQVNYSYDPLGNLTELTKEGRVYSDYPAYAKFKVFRTTINNTDYYNLNPILDIDSYFDADDPNRYTFLKVEKLPKDLIRILVLADFYLEFNSSQEFRDYINSNFDEFNENFLPFFVLKKLKLDSYLEL
jgi:hypothetical protein